MPISNRTSAMLQTTTADRLFLIAKSTSSDVKDESRLRKGRIDDLNSFLNDLSSTSTGLVEISNSFDSINSRFSFRRSSTSLSIDRMAAGSRGDSVYVGEGISFVSSIGTESRSGDNKDS